MKAFDIAIKDVKQAFRNKTALMFMFVVPLLITGLFFFIFGSSDEEAFDLPQTSVQVVNLDEGEFGEVLVEALSSEGLSDLLQVTETEVVDVARAAVDNQESGVAVIIPENFSAVMQAPDGFAEVEIYQDPTLTLGPGIVTTVVNQLTDGFAGSKIALGTSMAQLSAAGLNITPEIINQSVQSYIQGTQQMGGKAGLLSVETPSGDRTGNEGMMGMVGFIMAGMTIFYAFFTGASTVQTILAEEERGTMPRLFSTPTPQSTILYGKFLASALTVLIQMTVLLLFGSLVFKIYWGELFGLALVVVGIVASASTFGIFFVSFIKTNRQAGAMMGGGITLLGMIGMARIFTMSSPNPAPMVETFSLLVPQGWAVRGISASMDGGSIENILFSVMGMLVWSLVFFLIGNTRFKRRYV